jgi:hypothetical protein
MKRFPVVPELGARVRLVHCDDPDTRLERGTLGTVRFVDDMGTVHVDWDDGSHLGLVARAGDRFEVVDASVPDPPAPQRGAEPDAIRPSEPPDLGL